MNPAFAINPEISDERGFTLDLGLRGDIKDLISLDFTLFNLLYKDRIGFTQKEFKDGSVKAKEVISEMQ